MRGRFLRKTRSERGADRHEIRNERRTKLLRKKIKQTRPIQLNSHGLGVVEWASHPKTGPLHHVCVDLGR